MMGKFRTHLERDRAFDDELQASRYCNVAAAIIGGGALLISSSMASDSASEAASAQASGMTAAATSNTEVARIQQETAREYLNFQKQQYAELKPLAETVSRAQLDTMRQQNEIASSNERRAQEYADYEKGTFRPVEQGIVRDAQNFDTEAKREELARKGIADVATAYEAQRKQALDTLARYGINPNSARFASINAQLGMAEAADKAKAATDARTNAEQLGYARKLDAASLGRNLASNASTAYGIATSAGNSAVNSGNSAIDSAYQPGNVMGGAYGSFNQQMGNAGSSYTNSGNIYARGYGIAQDAANRANDATSGLIGTAVRGGIGYAVGGPAGAATAMTGIRFADGGKVHEGAGPVSGPGGPVDDKVPAMLSNGEYVLPADTVKKIGKKKLDKLIAETHTPAAVQRRRTALKGA